MLHYSIFKHKIIKKSKIFYWTRASTSLLLVLSLNVMY